jgi:hypothetical protein
MSMRERILRRALEIIESRRLGDQMQLAYLTIRIYERLSWG